MSEENSFSKGLFAEFPEDVAPLAARDQFKPWHKPRKQYVRSVLWRNELEWLLGNKKNTDRSLKYIGLPGEDLLDLRYFYEQFSSSFSTLRFLGFDTALSRESSGISVSLQEIKSLDKVDSSNSDIRADNFSKLSQENSVATLAARDFGPVDVVNADLCGNFGNDTPDVAADSLYSAFRTIFSIQNRRADPWCILLTTRIDRSSIDPVSEARMVEIVIDNLENCEGFSNSYLKFVDNSGAVDTSGMSSSVYFNVMSIGYSKWFARFALKIKSAMTISGVAKYKVDPSSDACDMLSVVYRFEPTYSGVNDPSGLAANADQNLGPSECKIVKGFPYAISHASDVDEMFNEDLVLRDEMIATSADLLVQARYDRDAYVTWCKSLFS